MTYPPGNTGYPSASQPGQYGGQPQQGQTQHQQPGDRGEQGSNKLPKHLLTAAAVLGLGPFIAAFGPIYDVDNEFGGGALLFTSFSPFATVLSILAALLAVASLLPKQRNHTGIVMALSVTAFLLALADLVNKPDGASVGWGLIVLLVFTALQAIASVGSLLLHSGVISPPAPRPKYDPYGQYGAPGQYYGPPSGQLPAMQQRPGGYGQQQYGGYGTGGFPVQGQPGQSGQPQHGQHTTAATPPTGFPSFSQPPAPGGSQQQPQQGTSPTEQIHAPTQQIQSPNQPPS